MKPANNAPIYVCMYQKLADIARKHGYALAIHGSVGRDFDLIAVPWVETAADPQTVVNDFVERFAVRAIETATIKEHGRLVYTLSLGFGECFMDLGFTPRQPLDKRAD